MFCVSLSYTVGVSTKTKRIRATARSIASNPMQVLDFNLVPVANRGVKPSTARKPMKLASMLIMPQLRASPTVGV